MIRKATHIIAALALAACIALTGCRSGKELRRAPDAVAQRDTSEAKPPVAPRAPRLDTITSTDFATLTANFRCSVDGVTVNGQLRMASDSIIWVSINKIVELGRARITPTRAQAYTKLMGMNYDLTYSDLRQRWGIDIDFATLQALLMGNCPPECRKSKEPQRSGDTVTLWMTQHNEQRQLTLQTDFNTKLLRAATLSSKATGQQIALSYGNRQNFAGQMLPTTISVSIKSRQVNEKTTITLDRITLNQPQSYPFKMN
jgi:hypothetical protein